MGHIFTDRGDRDFTQSCSAADARSSDLSWCENNAPRIVVQVSAAGDQVDEAVVSPRNMFLSFISNTSNIHFYLIHSLC